MCARGWLAAFALHRSIERLENGTLLPLGEISVQMRVAMDAMMAKL